MMQMRRVALPLIACSFLLGSSIFFAPEVSAQSTDPRAISMYNLGLNAYKQGSPESAIIFFKRATDIDANLADAQYNLGVLYQSQRRGKESVTRFQEVLRVKPNDSDAQYQLGIVNMTLGEYAEAKKYLNLIPPANVHFQDAQRRVTECDQKIANGITTPSVIPPQATGGDAVRTQEPPGGRTPVQQPDQVPAQQPGQLQSFGSTTQPYTPPAAANPPVVATVPSRPQQTRTAAGSKPTAVLANVAIRVIATGFHAPSGMTFDKQGNLYVANFESNTIDRISRDGTRTVFASGGNLKGPIGLVADDSGNLYVANYSGGTVARITPAGISTIIATDFKSPYYLTLGPGGTIFVSQQEDNSIIRISLPQTITAKPPASASVNP
ncbi:MAG: tetratricopeptide repeat protein [Candidatus Melainabacteria bacterium]|nr:tetratricopeptide repeat protein [Candidatus Melainabacteria bacterium]